MMKIIEKLNNGPHVCLFLLTNVVVVVIFCFPLVTVYNDKVEDNLPQAAQHNPCMTLHCIWYIYLSLKIQKQKE